MLSAYSQGSVVAFAEVDVVKDSGIDQKQITDAINENSGEFISIGGSNFTLDTGNTEVLTEIDNTGVNVYVYRDLFASSESKAKVQPVFSKCSSQLSSAVRRSFVLHNTETEIDTIDICTVSFKSIVTKLAEFLICLCQCEQRVSQKRDNWDFLNLNLKLDKAFLTLLATPGDDGPDFKTIAIIVGTVVPGLILIGLLIGFCLKYTGIKTKDKSKQYRYRGECHRRQIDNCI